MRIQITNRNHPHYGEYGNVMDDPNLPTPSYRIVDLEGWNKYGTKQCYVRTGEYKEVE